MSVCTTITRDQQTTNDNKTKQNKAEKSAMLWVVWCAFGYGMVKSNWVTVYCLGRQALIREVKGKTKKK